MITLNLLPPANKEIVWLREIYVTIKNVIFCLLLLTIVVAIALLVSQAILQNQFNEVVDGTTLTTRFGRISNPTIKTFNAQIDRLDSIQSRSIMWSRVINALAATVPDGVELTSLALATNSQDQQTVLLITATAQTREDLLQFESRLKASGMVSEIVIPLEDKLKRTNASFSLRAVMVPTALH